MRCDLDFETTLTLDEEDVTVQIAGSYIAPSPGRFDPWDGGCPPDPGEIDVVVLRDGKDITDKVPWQAVEDAVNAWVEVIDEMWRDTREED